MCRDGVHIIISEFMIQRMTVILPFEIASKKKESSMFHTEQSLIWNGTTTARQMTEMSIVRFKNQCAQRITTISNSND